MPLNTKRTIPLDLIWILIIGIGFQITAAIPTAYGSAGQWQYIEDSEGVALYRSLKEARGLLPFKAVAELETPYEKIVMALVDAERKPEWAPKLKATAIHLQFSSNRFVYSEYYKTPWPFKDREFLLDGTVAYRRDRVVFSAVNAENTELAKRDHVMANIQELTLSLKPLSEDRTRVEFIFSGDMGGWIPDFVKTIIQKRWPVRFMQALRDYLAANDRLETPRYRSLNKPLLEVPKPVF